MAHKTPLAFLSYAHDDDEHEQGKLRAFAKRLAGEVRLHSGEEFPIFVDRDIEWGREWETRIMKSLDGATFLIPILTPGYFKSDYCRKECLRFLERERKLKRTDLILPVYYVRCPVMEDEAKRKADELARLLNERQYTDWRPRRHEPWTTPEVSRQFEQMALRIVEVLEQVGLVHPVEEAPVAVERTANSVTVGQVEAAPGAKSDPKEPHTVVVDALHRGQYTSIAQAIKNEPAGTRILVRPCNYREALVIDKPLEIVGDGNRDDVVVEADGSNVVHFRASMGRLANVTLRQRGGKESYAVDIAQGRLDLEDCDVSSRSLSAVAVHNGAAPRVRRNQNILGHNRYGPWYVAPDCEANIKRSGNIEE